MQRTAWLVVVIMLLPFSASWSDVIHVPGDATYLLGAVSQASSGDTVLVAPGVYAGSGYRRIDFEGKDITVISEGGADVTTIDCEGVGPAFMITQGEHAVLDGFTILNAHSPRGGALTIDGMATPVVRGCTFIGSEAVAGGVASCMGESVVLFEDCAFQDNTASDRGGVLEIVLCEVTLNRCEFVQNTAELGGVFQSVGTHDVMVGGLVTASDCVFRENTAGSGAVLFCTYWGNDFYAERCVFEDNTAYCAPLGCTGVLAMAGGYVGISECVFARNVCEQGSIISCVGGVGYGYVENTTFAENSAEYGLIALGSIATISNTIIAFSVSGPAICYGNSPILSCCDIYGNAGGDWTGAIADQLGVNGNMHQDPMFCEEANPGSPYSLQEDSPCAAANSGGCGLIGVYDVGCSSSVSENTSWGCLKVRYRER